MSDAEGDESEPVEGVVLDYLAHGRAGDDRPQYQKAPVAYALGVADFRLLELRLAEGEALTIGDRVAVDPPAAAINRVRPVEYEDLSGGAQSELEYVVEDIVADEEMRFVDFYNEAQAITTRLHALNLLPGIGKKLRNSVLDERKRRPFESIEDLEERVPGLHDPQGVLVDRIMEELREEDLKYRIFARRDEN